MFYVRYALAELRRRKARTLLTALVLATGVGLVVAVTALSRGLDEAQERVLEPLTGVGTDITVTRPLRLDSSSGGSGGPSQLSEVEQRRLEAENGDQRLGLTGLGQPGERFRRDRFLSAQLSYPENTAQAVAAIAGVQAVARELTLNVMRVSGTVPTASEQGGGVIRRGFGAGAGGGPPRTIAFTGFTVTGLDTANPALGLVTPSQVRKGRYFRGASPREALLADSYANRKKLAVGDKVKVGSRTFRIVGIVTSPLGGRGSDIYLPLAQLQGISGRKGRVNTLRVRAASADRVATVGSAIESKLDGAEVTTAADLAKRVSGSLVDARNLAHNLGVVLAVVAIASAFAIAVLLTLSGVNKRVRELGTLKAIGWPRRLLVRQVVGESLAQSALGGVVGAVLGIAAAALVAALAPDLTASTGGMQTAGSAGAAPPGPGPQFGPPGPFGQGAVAPLTRSVSLSAPVDPQLVALAVVLALAGGALAGIVGGNRAGRLRPAEALRSVE